MGQTIRKNLNFPRELATEIEAAARRNFRDFTAEVLWRCVSHAHPIHAAGASDTHEAVSTMHIPYTSEVHPIHAGGVSDAHPTHIPYTSDAPVEDDEDEPQTPADRAWLLDLLLADGNPAQKNSNFQVRRKRQVEFLKEQWQAMFGKPLTDATAKQLLRDAGESAQSVYAAMEVAAGRGITGNGLIGYVTKVIKSNAEKAKQPPTPEKPAEGKHPWDTAPTLREPTAEDYAEWERAERLWELTESGDNT